MPEISWSPSTWQAFPALHQPAWPNHEAHDAVIAQLSSLPALVFAGETRALRLELAEASYGRAFVLQCGDCAEDFAMCHGPRIHALVKVILQMSIILAYAGERRVVNIGRLAGQYAKPRSSETEDLDGHRIPSFFGEMVNGAEPTLEARRPDPKRILEGYFRASATLNLVRAFTRGGYAALDHVEAWHRDFLDTFPPNPLYEKLAKGIRKAVRFAGVLGFDLESPQLNQITLYTSHEALLLAFEEAMARIDTTTGDWYDTSAHFLWIGNRTRQVEGAHVEFLRGIHNPIGVKIGPGHDLDDILRLIDRLDPNGEPGRLTLIPRLGATHIARELPNLIRTVRASGHPILWICDPMHGNTYKNTQGQKTRSLPDIVQELRYFTDIHRAEGTVPGGVHLEITGDLVTECVGGGRNLQDADLASNYSSTCDPRLNAEQAVELAFEIASFINPEGC